MNKVILTGRLTAEPEIRYTSGDNPVAIASYTLAVARDFKNANGEYEADFIRCKAFGKRGEFVEKYLSKGQKVLVEGRLQTGSYEKDGQKHYTTDLIVEKHEFLEKKSGSATPSENASNDVYAAFVEAEADDIPF